MSHNPAISIKNVSVSYSGQATPTIEAISFDVKKGTIATLLGPNGAGKSTLIKAVLGLVDYHGEINLFGKKSNQLYNHIGYVPQRFSIDKNIPITVKEFLTLALINCPSCYSKKTKRISAALNAVDLKGFEHLNVSQLSGGQLQRVLLARALVHKPKLLILDEPEAGIDVGAEQSLYQLLQKLAKEKKLTILIASHELDVVYGYSDQVVCINHRLICTGKPKLVLNKDTFTQMYGGNITFYTHGHK